MTSRVPHPGDDLPVAVRPGRRSVFKDEKLIVFSPGEVLVLRAWPRSAAWSRKDGGPWLGARPLSPLLTGIAREARPGYVSRRLRQFRRRLAEDADPLLEPVRATEFAALTDRLRAGWGAGHRAAKGFLSTFPREVTALVLPLRERQWHLVQLVAHCPGALDLALTNRGLAVALASSWVFRDAPVARPLRSARALVRKSRAEIAGWLGFPGSPSTVGILGKIRTDALTAERLLWLRAALREPEPPKALRHLPALDGVVLRILCDPALRGAAAYSLLEEIVTAPDDAARRDAPFLLRDALDAHAILGLRWSLVARSLEEVRIMHDELTAEVNERQWLAEDAALTFPAPPHPGTPDIVPLTSGRELFSEGRAMHHCAASHAPRVAGGRAYLYRVHAPERATLSLVRGAAGWHLAQIKTFANGRVAPETLAAVREWFDATGLAPAPAPPARFEPGEAIF